MHLLSWQYTFAACKTQSAYLQIASYNRMIAVGMSRQEPQIKGIAKPRTPGTNFALGEMEGESLGSRQLCESKG
jgi:hypothetical protein